MTQYQTFPADPGNSLTLDKLKTLRLPAMGGCRFLDVGCNEGFFCGFARFQGAVRSVGIDHSRQFVARARERFPDCEFLCQDWSRLPDETFDVILLASAMHYADDQQALVRDLVARLSDSGTLILEVGVAHSSRAEWVEVDRGIDVRKFPSMKMLREILSGYAWKWMGPSIPQAGDPVPRHVIHVSRRKPVAYLLMQPPGYGKSSIASGLFPLAGIPIVSGDEVVSRIAKGRSDASPGLKEAIGEDYSPYRIDRSIERVFDRNLGEELVGHWLEAHREDVALDVFIPDAHQSRVEQLVAARGYLPVVLRWERTGCSPLPDDALAQQADAFYMSLVAPSGTGEADAAGQSVEPVGFVDEVSVADGFLVVRGWAIDRSGDAPASIELGLGRKPLRVVSRERQLRTDVQAHLGLRHALVGYRLWIDLADVPAGDPRGWLSGLAVQSGEGTRYPLAGALDEVFKG